MAQSMQSIGSGEAESAVSRPARKSSYLKLLLRYPILLLASGPPYAMVPADLHGNYDPTQPHYDFWILFRVALLFVVAARAVYRLASAPSLLIPRSSRTVLSLAFFLGVLFAISSVYSSGRTLTIEYAFMYLLTLICVVEFLVDVYQDPPDWMHFVFGLRFICLASLFLLLLVLPFNPQLGIMNTHYGFRLLGGGICQVNSVCPVIAIISAYSFLHSLGSKILSAFFFLAGAIALAASQWRGAEISLLLVLIVLGIAWARTRKHFVRTVVSVAVASILFTGLVIAVLGSHRVWATFSHDQEPREVLHGSGRFEQWSALLNYSVRHPQGMGYVAGIRSTRIGQFAKGERWEQSPFAFIDNGYMEVLGDAGWLAFLIYATILVMTAACGWRLVKSRSFASVPQNGVTSDSLRCTMLLFMYFLLQQMENSDYAIPLRQSFYLQYIVIAFILGQSAVMLSASHSVEAPITE